MKRMNENITNAVLSPIILTAINRHGLIIFVVSNLMTGMVNLSINTLAVGNAGALLILILYVVAIAGLALVLDVVFPPAGTDTATSAMQVKKES